MFLLCKKKLGCVFYGWLSLFFMATFIMFSILVLLSTEKHARDIAFQIVACICLFLLFKYNLPDRMALLVEVPKIEKRIKNIRETGIIDDDVEIYEGYIIFAWEPGFLDYQMVVAYNEDDTLKKAKNGRTKMDAGTLYIVARAKSKFYLCVLYR